MKKLLPFFILTLLLTGSGCEMEPDCVKPAQCELVPDPGLCKAYFPRYYYDQAEGKCREFIWGGCGGVVPFETLEACRECECAGSLDE
jgi:hypothetical protein